MLEVVSINIIFVMTFTISGAQNHLSRASLTSGISYAQLPRIQAGRRHSLNKLSDAMSGSHVSLARRSARQHGVKDVKIVADPHGRKVLLYIKTNLNHVLVQFAQYRPVQWFLKPLFFQVPQREPNSLFIGRRWLYSEIADHLLSETSDNRGVIITGTPGSGKTAIMLQLVDHSCFGRGQSGLRGKELNILIFSYQLRFNFQIRHLIFKIK
jgi:hypothetical protein